MRRSLPGSFALPAGLGDVAVGLSAPFVAADLVRGGRASLRLYLGWTAFGILDLLGHHQRSWSRSMIQ